MGAKSRNKGKRGELEVAAFLSKHGFEATRNARNGVDEAEDIAHTIPGLWIEVKRTERLQLDEAFRQAEKACGGNVPVVVHRKNNQEWRVTLPLTEFLGRIK